MENYEVNESVMQIVQSGIWFVGFVTVIVILYMIACCFFPEDKEE